MRVPEGNKWDKDELAKVRVTPWSLHVPQDAEVVFKEKKQSEAKNLEDKVIIARNLYVKASDLAEYGLTRGCLKCDHELANGAGRTSQPHSSRCKSRILGELSKTEAGRVGIAAATAR